MPLPPLQCFGVWEDDAFIGAVLYGRGANMQIGKRYGLALTEACELVRVALREHRAAVSQIVAITLRMLRKHNPDLRLVVSFADPEQGHSGRIYQAGNWLYLGETAPTVQFFHEGRWKHTREVLGGAFGGERKVADASGLVKRTRRPKHRYAYPFDRAMRAELLKLAEPYPK